jgi:hypothetical protein
MEQSELQNTTRGFFIFADDSTAFGTGKTGLTISSTLAKASSTANSVSPTITEVSGGWYWVVPLAAHRDTLGRALWQFSASGAVIAGRVEKIILANDQLAAFGANTTTPPTAGAIADAVWDEAYSGHTTAGTFGKLMDILRKSNNVIEGTILASPTPTTTVFRISGANYPTGALEHSVLWMSTGASAEQNSPILTTVNNGDATLTITLEEALVTAPVAGDTVLIDPTSHVHAIAAIVSGVWSAASSAYSATTGTMGLIMYAFSQMLELVSSVWRWKATSLTQAPSGGGGDGIYAITLVAASSGGNVPGTTFSIVGTVTNVTTNSGGTAVLNLNAGTYTLRTTTPPGYQSVADSSLVVSADATVTKTLVATSYAPTTAPGCTVTIPVRSQYTTALAGVDVKIKFIGWETGATKPATILSPPPIQASDANGLVSVILYRHARYTATYTVEGDTTKVVAFTTPNAGSYVVIEG